MTIFAQPSTRLLIGICLTLAACGNSEPSEGDIKNLFDKEIAENYKRWSTQGDAGKSFAKLLPKIEKVRKLGCVQDQGGAVAFKCDVEVTQSIGDAAPQTRVANLRFVKGTDGWSAER